MTVLDDTVPTGALRAGRVLMAWVSGLAGSVAAILGFAGVMMAPEGQSEAITVLGATTAVWLIVAAIGTGRVPGAQLGAQAGATATALPLAASGVGRIPAVVAVTSVFLAFAAIVEWRPWPSFPPRRSTTAWSAVVLLGLGQWCWTTFDSGPATLATFALGFGVVCEHHRAHSMAHAVERSVGRALLAPLLAAARLLAASPAAVLRARDELAARVERSRIDADLRRASFVGLLVSLAFFPVFWRLVNVPNSLVLGINDIGLHVESAHRFSLVPFHLEVPQFLFHVVTAAMSVVVGDSAGPVVTLTLAMWATYLGVYAVARRPLSPDSARLEPVAARWFATLALFVETPTLILMMARVLGANTRFLSIHVLYSPTWVVALPFVFFILALLDAGFAAMGDDPTSESGVATRRSTRRSGALLGAVVAFGTMAKPSFTLCLVPGLVVYAVLFERRHVRPAIRLWAWVAVPGIAVVLWQTWFLSTSTSALGSDGFAFDPISGPVYGWSQVTWPFWLPIVGLLVVATAISRGAFLRERLVRLVFCCFAVALPIFLLFVETGLRAKHGNLGVPSQVCVTLLALLALRRIVTDLIRRSADGQSRSVAAEVAGRVATMAFLGGGVLSYADALGLVHIPIRWFPFY